MQVFAVNERQLLEGFVVELEKVLHTFFIPVHLSFDAAFLVIKGDWEG